MSREAFIKQLEGLSEDELSEVLKFVKLLQGQSEELSNEELQEVREGQEEFRRREWVRWEDIKRDV